MSKLLKGLEESLVHREGKITLKSQIIEMREPPANMFPKTFRSRR